MLEHLPQPIPPAYDFMVGAVLLWVLHVFGVL